MEAVQTMLSGVMGDARAFADSIQMPVITPRLAIAAGAVWGFSSLLINAMRAKFNVKGKVILVTGASSGLGRAIVIELAKMGAKAIAVARSGDKLDELKKEVEGMKCAGEVDVYVCDCSDGHAVEEMAKQVTEKHGTPDCLMLSAGLGRWLYPHEMSVEEAEQAVRAPMMAAFYTVRAFLPSFLARNEGVIVNINSPAHICPWPGSTLYASMRSALAGFHESLYQDLYSTRVTPIMVTLGEIASGYWEHNPGATERMPKTGKLFSPTMSSQKAAKGVLSCLYNLSEQSVIPFSLKSGLDMKYWPVPGIHHLVRWLTRQTDANIWSTIAKGDGKVKKA